MFAREAYIQRRAWLKRRLQSGLVLLLGNDESPMNYAANTYPFRQDSTFLYYFGLDQPQLAALIDLDEGAECVFGHDPTVEEIVWTGPQPPLLERCERVGVTHSAPSDELAQTLRRAVKQGRAIHVLPQYRAENVLKLRQLPVGDCGLGIDSREADPQSANLIRAVIQQRSVKSAEEIEQIEAALEISWQMHTTAMKMARPGVMEYEVAGAMEGIAVSQGVRLAFPTVFSVHGETLHNPSCGNVMRAGDIAINDSGAESRLHYASDISRTIPVSGTFSQRQREIYSIILDAEQKAIDAIRPGVEFRQVHRLACVAIASGLKQLGLMAGDPQQAVEAGAHTLFFPCGVGHMLGLDVHDMEPLGEDYVGYTDDIRRNPAFGWRSLRLARAVEPGFVVTVEPGIYFVPQLIDRWRAEGRHTPFIDYNRVDKYRNGGGTRVEDNILVTEQGCRLLGAPIPKSIDDIETATSL